MKLVLVVLVLVVSVVVVVVLGVVVVLVAAVLLVLASVLACERSCGAADAHHKVWRCAIGVQRSDVVDRSLVGTADEPRLPDDHWNDVDRFPDALVQLHAEIPDELVEDEVAALERLQHEDLFRCRLSVARERGNHQQAAQNRHSQCAAQASNSLSTYSSAGVLPVHEAFRCPGGRHDTRAGVFGSDDQSLRTWHEPGEARA